MLEIRNITKIYRSKTGESVKALDNVSIQFPETGMVFILGKSGSGKSTLLNVMGGLDSYDEGEFIIKGKSSKDFGGSDFDAYRNTFIGFIFQEYNVLDDFTVGANIGLALELQGKKATDEAINNILAQVDLLNYAKRKPNELSGGQKQRVAIARALVKDPQIIMADEPTGALDSNTGKQIFDTLKELSKEKLVLIVSHDRDFAEKYADRIVELADGKIIEDVSKHEHKAERLSDGVHRINDHILRIEGGYRLTAKDLDMINDYLAKNNADVLLSGDNRVNEELRSAVGISKDGSSTVFESTNEQEDIKVKSYEKGKTKFIRSRLPMKNAVKMGSSSLKHKTVRLIFTILLSLVAFAMFGIADTMAAYNKINAATTSIQNAGIKTASFALYPRETYYRKDETDYYYNQTDSFNEDDVAALKEKTGMEFLPVFTGSTSAGRKIPFSSYYLEGNKDAKEAYPGSFSGFVAMGEEHLAAYGFNLVAGRMPEGTGEITITKHTYDQFAYYGYKYAQGESEIRIKGENLKMDDSANSILGKKLQLQIGASMKEYVIVGVLDTKFDAVRYADYLPSTTGGEGDGGNTGGGGNAEGGLMDQMMLKELANTLTYDFHCLGIFSADQIAQLAQYAERNYNSVGTHLNNLNLSMLDRSEDQQLANFWMVAANEALSNLEIQWLDGEPRTELGEGEIVISANAYSQLLQRLQLEPDFSALHTKAEEELGSYYAGTDPEQNVFFRVQNALNQYGSENARAEKAAALFDTYVTMLDLKLEDAEHLTDMQKLRIVNSINSDCTEKTVQSHHIVWMRLGAYVYSMVYADNYALLDNSTFRETVLRYDSEFNFNRSDEELARAVLEYTGYAENYYAEYGRESNPHGAYTYNYFEKDAMNIMMRLSNLPEDAMQDIVYFKASTSDWDKNGNQTTTPFATYEDWKIVGIHNDQDGLIVSVDFNTAYRTYALEEGYSIWERAPHKSGIYSHVIAPMPSDPALIAKLAEISYQEGDEIVFKLQNHVMDTLQIFNEFVEPGAKIFLFVGLGLALFASILLMNFISTSISYKKREIGILRAVGARSSDVFKIFFSEAAIIALINFVLASAAAITATFFINNWMASEGISVTLLNFGARQVALMLGVSLLAAFLSSFLPVYKIAKKKPVDAIKDR